MLLTLVVDTCEEAVVGEFFANLVKLDAELGDAAVSAQESVAKVVTLRAQAEQLATKRAQTRLVIPHLQTLLLEELPALQLIVA